MKGITRNNFMGVWDFGGFHFSMNIYMDFRLLLREWIHLGVRFEPGNDPK